jgi:CRISPR/Cas system endoribonuclease Cas6 (RAMP superfamily)
MHTIKTVKAANKKAGYYFFSPSTMRFFASKIESHLMYGGDQYGYFVTSEKTGFDSVKREYKVRQANFLTGEVCTIPSSMGESTYRNYCDALEKAKSLAAIDAEAWVAAQKAAE